jgi:hypothetical protein
MTNSITKNIMTIIAKHCQKELNDFNRIGVHLNKKNGDLYHCINFQASQWNSAENGEFTINLVVTSPVLYCYWAGRPFPKNPASATWPICESIGFLLPEHGSLWWKVNNDTNTNKLSIEVLDLIKTYGLPFLNNYKTIDDIGSKMQPNRELLNILIKAIISKVKNNDSESLALLQSALSQSKGKPFEESIKIIAQRLGLSKNLQENK